MRRSSDGREIKCFIGGALSLGTHIEINDMHGYSPLVNEDKLAEDAAHVALPEIPFSTDMTVGTGSTDMGDISMIIPSVHPYIPGAEGISHGSNYRIADPETACVGSAKWQVAMLYLLLKDEGVRAKEILAKAKTTFASKEEFIEYIDTFEMSGERIQYNEDGTANIKLKENTNL